RGHQQLGASRQGQGTRLSHYPKPEGNGLPARWKTRHAAVSVRSLLPMMNSAEPISRILRQRMEDLPPIVPAAPARGGRTYSPCAAASLPTSSATRPPDAAGAAHANVARPTISRPPPRHAQPRTGHVAENGRVQPARAMNARLMRSPRERPQLEQRQ